MIVMAISDVMTLNFFYMVRDEGSWLDIGTTISHFCIASFLCVFVAGLEFLSEVFISGVEVKHELGSAEQKASQKPAEILDVSKGMNGKEPWINGAAKGHTSAGDNAKLAVNGSAPC
jgi:GPI ethanolamine phosphate transferase 1